MFENAATLVGIVIPLFTIAGSAAAFIIRYYADSKHRRDQEFFLLMEILDSSKPLASKTAAAYQLRAFPEHSEFIVRFYENLQGNVYGDAASTLGDELARTADYFKTRS